MNFTVKTILIAFAMLFFAQKAYSTHIVGGEFEMVHVTGYEYNFNLILYFDDVNGNPEILATENTLTAFIYRKRDNLFMRSVVLNKTGTSFVPYTNIECTIESLRTRKLKYTNSVFMDPTVFNDPEGYYIVWERCCRNNTIDNIVLIAPNTVGQTFYLEFPPVVDENNDPFVNSSPVLFPPLSDYGCVGQFYYVDFAGKDEDGDSIAYSMVNPLNSSTVAAVPPPSPRPHGTVPWIPGIDVNNQVPGNPSLGVSPEGLLTVTPSQAGLFVFAVRAEEFREGKKIGEVRRDFQMLVIDCPNPGAKPDIFARVKGESSIYKDGSIISFKRGDEKCVELFIQDADAPEALTIRAKPVNFNADISDILSLNGGFIATATDTLKAEVCFPDCPYKQDQPMFVDLIAYDDACSLPLSDTVRIGVIIEPPTNTKPEIVNPGQEVVSELLREGDTYEIPIRAIDVDNDSLSLAVMTDGFNMADFGMSITTTKTQKGELEALFVWDTRCDVYDFTQRTTFDIKILVDDFDTCLFANPDTLCLDLEIKLPTNNDPEVSTDLKNNSFAAFIGETIDFNVLAKDIDDDVIALQVIPSGFALDSYNINFKPVTGEGAVESPFSWELDCDLFDLEAKDKFTFKFVATDADKCKFPNADSLSVTIKILPNPNDAPVINLGERVNEAAVYKVGEEIKFTVFGSDINNDSVYIDILNKEELEGISYSFQAAKGLGIASSEFEWIPSCADLNYFMNLNQEQGRNDEFVTFSFIVRDGYCIEPAYDTIHVDLGLEDIAPPDADFIPPNVFTPNDDGINDYFTIPNLPLDNCDNEFLKVTIYNRHGRLVYSDDSREFKWDGKGFSAGSYYYYLHYTNDEYTGVVSIIY